MTQQITNTYVSDRGYALTYYGAPPKQGEKPILTVENYTKWYHLYLVHSTGQVTKLDYAAHELPDYHGTEWADHVPHPDYYAELCRHHGFQRDESAYQLILGRYLEEIIWGGPKGDHVSQMLGIKSLHTNYTWE